MSNQHSSKTSSAGFSDLFQKFSKLTMDMMTSSFENNLKVADEMGNLFKNVNFNLPSLKSSKSGNCCPPEPYCPPQCLIEITREAYAGEFIVVPFAVKNTCGTAKRYQIGLRLLLDQDGNPAPVQPNLNKQEVDLQPGQSVNVLMYINLMQGVSAGDCYHTDIVIREKEVNQNICFTLKVLPFCDVPVAAPIDEKHYFNHWQSWQSHFYCEKKPQGTRLNTNLSVNRTG